MTRLFWVVWGALCLAFVGTLLLRVVETINSLSAALS